MAEYRRQKRSDLKKRKRGEFVKEEPDDEHGAGGRRRMDGGGASTFDPEMAEMMGFAGFGTSKKAS